MKLLDWIKESSHAPVRAGRRINELHELADACERQITETASVRQFFSLLKNFDADVKGFEPFECKDLEDRICMSNPTGYCYAVEIKKNDRHTVYFLPRQSEVTVNKFGLQCHVIAVTPANEYARQYVDRGYNLEEVADGFSDPSFTRRLRARSSKEFRGKVYAESPDFAALVSIEELNSVLEERASYFTHVLSMTVYVNGKKTTLKDLKDLLSPTIDANSCLSGFEKFDKLPMSSDLRKKYFEFTERLSKEFPSLKPNFRTPSSDDQDPEIRSSDMWKNFNPNTAQEEHAEEERD